MNIALVLQHKLLVGFQRLLSSIPAPTAATKTPHWQSKHALSAQTPIETVPINYEPAATLATSPRENKVMPLRVLRVVEKGQPRSCTGRLVISGRMADVCAELDRLVAREAALH
jgi:hypothetical protein